MSLSLIEKRRPFLISNQKTRIPQNFTCKIFMLTKPQEDNSMVLQGEAQYETDIGSKEGICNKG